MSVRTTVKSIQDIMRQDVGVDGDAQRLSQLCWMFFLKIIDDQDQQFEVMQDDYRSPIPESLQWRTWAADPEGITGDTLLAFINTELFPTLKELPITGANANRSRVVRSVFEDAYNYMKSGQLMRQVINKISSVDFNDLAERKHFGDIYEQLLNDLQSAGNAGEYYTPRAVTAFMVDRIDPKPGETLFDPSCGTGGFLTCAIRHMRERYVKKVEDEQALQAGLRAVEKKQLPHMLCVTNMLLHGIEDPSFVRHDNTLARPYISYGQSDRVDIILTNPPFGGREEDGIESNFPAHFRTKETADLFLALYHPPAQTRWPRRHRAARRLAVWRRRQNPPQGTPAGRVQPAHHRAPAQQRVQTLRQHRHQLALLRKGRADQGNLVLRAPRARRPESLLHDQAHPRRAPARLRGLVGRRGTRRPARKPKSRGKSASTRSRPATTTSTSKTPTPSPTTTATRQNCWPNWNKTNSTPPACATSSRPFWRRRCCDERRTPAATLRPHQRSARCHPASAPVHSGFGRARQTGGTRPQRRTGGGTAEADSGGEGAVGEGREDQA